jgi:acetylornithine deacetylase/succinyl-diaminopimelate desuccinylase-like protein
VNESSAREKRLLRFIDDHVESYIDDIMCAVRQPSVSQSGEGVAEMAEWIASYLRDLGADVRLVPGRHAPIVEGELGADSTLPKLLLYELYDVQPAAGQPGWSVPPFAASTITDETGRRRLVGRGTFNSKGPLVASLAVLKACRDSGIAPPVNLRFLIEGEEEIGSPSLPGYIEANRAQLAACDAAFIPYFSTTERGETVLRLGFKGLVLLEFRVAGGTWGGPARGDIHALHGALVTNPAWYLIRALASLVDQYERLVVDGLDRLMPPPDPLDLELISVAAQQHDFAAYRTEIGVDRLKRDAPAADLLKDLMLSATLNIDAIAAGEIDEGTDPATIIPRTARAFADLRLLDGMEPPAVVDLIRAHLDRRGFNNVQIRVRAAYPASRSRHDEPVVKAMIEACRAHAADVRVYPIHAGAAPMYLFSKVLGLPYAFGGVGHGGRSHAPNEYIMVDDIAPFMKSIASFLFRFAEHARGHPC